MTAAGRICMALLSASSFHDDPFGGLREGVFGLYVPVRVLLEVVLGLAAMLILARIVLKLMNGDRDSAKTLLWWLAGLAFGLVMLEVLARWGTVGPMPV